MVFVLSIFSAFSAQVSDRQLLTRIYRTAIDRHAVSTVHSVALHTVFTRRAPCASAKISSIYKDKLHHAFLPLPSARAMLASNDLLQQFKNMTKSRNTLEDSDLLMASSKVPGSEFGFDIAENFHTEDQDARWVPELVRLVQEFGGGQGSKPNSKKVNYHTLQVNREPCGCLYDYDGTNGRLVVWGADDAPPIIGEMMQHFIQRLGLQDDHDVPGCLVINVYKENTHHIDWHSDANPRWGAMDKDTNIFTWSLGTHGFFQLTVKARSQLAKFAVGKEGKASVLKTAGYRWGWVVEPRSISVMSKRCQKSCMHRVMKPDKARTMKAVLEWPDYIHHSAKTPRVIVSLRTIRQHDDKCAHSQTASRWLSGISPLSCTPCASTDAAITPSTQDMSYVAATSQTPMSSDVSALPISAQVPNDVQKRAELSSEDEQMQEAQIETPSTQDMSYVAATSQAPKSLDVSALPISAQVPNDVQKRDELSSEDEPMQESQIEPVRDQPVPQTKTATKPIGQHGNIIREVHSQVMATFETRIQRRLQFMKQYREILPLTHPSVVTGFTRRARLYRVVMRMARFRTIIGDAMSTKHREHLRQGKWCFTMTPAVRDDLFWIDLTDEPTFKLFNWTQNDLPENKFCSIDKLEFSMEYHKTCCRTTHCQPPLSSSVGTKTESTILSNIRDWSNFITDVKMSEMLSTQNGVLECPPLPQDWPCECDLYDWPMICWTVGSFLVQK